MPEILSIESAIAAMPQVDLPVEHYRIKGVYVRSLFIPEGTVLTGKIHNAENIAILAQGTIKVCDGDKSYEISAPKIMVDKPGVKRLGYAVTDVTFITVHRTDGESIADIEAELVSDSFDQYERLTLQEVL